MNLGNCKISALRCVSCAFGFTDDPFDKPPCRGCSSYLTEPYVKCAECGPPPFLLCLQVSARMKVKAVSLRESSKGCPVPSCSINTLITGLCKLVLTHLFAQGQGNDKENTGGWRTEQLKEMFVEAAKATERHAAGLCNGACRCLSEKGSFLSFFKPRERKAIRKHPFPVPTCCVFFFPNGKENLGKVCSIDWVEFFNKYVCGPITTESTASFNYKINKFALLMIKNGNNL